ncbi:MAG: hypothetical protein WC657_01675 [Candidatus Paceibacterota bacterium]|jgi:Arc/MetJ family transcription regulator
MPKPLNQLTREEATELARKIVRTSSSDEEVRRRLTEAGFNGDNAEIQSRTEMDMYQAMVAVWGPYGAISA